MGQVEKFAGNSANPANVLLLLLLLLSSSALVLDIFRTVHNPPLRTPPKVIVASPPIIPTYSGVAAKPTQKFLRQRLLPLGVPHLLLDIATFPFVLSTRVLLAAQHLGAKTQCVLRHLVQCRELFDALRILGGSRGRFEATAFGLGVVGEGEGVVAFEDGLHVHFLFVDGHLLLLLVVVVVAVMVGGGGWCAFRCVFCIGRGGVMVARVVGMVVAVDAHVEVAIAGEGSLAMERRAPTALLTGG
mmetsp:Transcript_11999/g.22837  ORF Transcript_11999/g.22837 Transcript_11999/m.22837 type:complete len:244 (+) Transcript_11999:3580-4311(+)